MADKIIFGYTDFDEENMYQTTPNGFSSIEAYIHNSNLYNKESRLNAYSIKTFKDHIMIYCTQGDTHKENLFILKNVNNIGENQKYIYLISTYSLIISCSGVAYYTIPKKVLDDIKEKRCVILFERLWEGDGTFSDYFASDIMVPDQLGKGLHELYDIPYSSIFFMNSNLNVKYFNTVHPVFGVNFFENFFTYIKEEEIIRYREYILNPSPKKFKFCCLNKSQRDHRIYLAYLLFDLACNTDTVYTFNIFNELVIQTHFPHVLKNIYNVTDEDKISKMIDSLPWIHDNVNKDDSFNDYSINCDVYRESYFNVVTETYFEKDIKHYANFFTEKTYKPIRALQPFILVSTPHSLKKLREIGYETFPEIIDESYDDIEDDKERLEVIAKEVRRLYSKSKEELHNMVVSVIDKLEHNAQLLKSRVDNNHNMFYDTLQKEIYDNWPK